MGRSLQGRGTPALASAANGNRPAHPTFIGTPMSIDRQVGIVPDRGRCLDGCELPDPTLLQTEGDGIREVLVEDIRGLLEIGVLLDVGQIALENTLLNIKILSPSC